MFGNIFNKFNEAQELALKTIQESQEFFKTSGRSYLDIKHSFDKKSKLATYKRRDVVLVWPLKKGQVLSAGLFLEDLKFKEFKKLAKIVNSMNEEDFDIREEDQKFIQEMVDAHKGCEVFMELVSLLEGGEMDEGTVEISESVKQAGVDYPMHLIDNDGFHTFVWNEVVIVLSKDDASAEVVEKIKTSSFEMFKTNADIQKQTIKDTLKKAVEQEVTKVHSDGLDKLVEQEIIPPTATESLQDDLKEAVASIEQPKTVEQTAMAAAIHKAIGEDTLKAAAAEDRIYDDKTFKFNRVKRRR